MIFCLLPMPGMPAGLASPRPARSGAYKVYVGYLDALRPAAENFPIPWGPGLDTVYVGCNPADCGRTLAGGRAGVDGGAIRVVNTSGADETVSKVRVTFGGGSAPCAENLLTSPQFISPGESLIANASDGGGGSVCGHPAGTMDSSDYGTDGRDWVGNCFQSAMVPRIRVTVDGSTTSFADTGQVLNTGGVDLAECAIPGRRVNESQPWVPVGMRPGCRPAALTLAPVVQSVTAPHRATLVAHIGDCGGPLPGICVHLVVLSGPNDGSGGVIPCRLTNQNGNAAISYPYIGGGTGTADVVQALAGALSSSHAIVDWKNTRTPALQLSVKPASPLAPRRAAGREVYEVTLAGNKGTPDGTVLVQVRSAAGQHQRCVLKFSGRTGTTVSQDCPRLAESTAGGPYAVMATFAPARGNRYKSTRQAITVAGQATDAHGNATIAVTGPGGAVTLSGKGKPKASAVTASQYGTNPVLGLSDGTSYFDASVTSGITRAVITDCENVTPSTALKWFNPKAGRHGRWQPVAGHPATLTGGEPPCLAVTIDRTSKPMISQLNGTVFASVLTEGITSSAEENGYVGRKFSFTVTTSGTPVPSLTEHGKLLPGLRFTAHDDGTATISGTMPPDPQSTTVTVRAAFGRRDVRSQRLTIAAVGNTTPPPPLVPRPKDIAGFGAQTTQYVFDQFSSDYNATVKTSAPHLFSYDVTGTAKVVAKTACPAEPRPDGASAGILAAIGGPLALTANLADPQGGTGFCTDFARSDRARAVGDPAGIVFVPFALDAVSYATNAGSNAPADLTTAQLARIYTCAVTNWAQVGGKNAPIDAQLPQIASGTRKVFLTALGKITPGSCVDSRKGESPNKLPEENEGTSKYLQGPDVIYPYSVADWIAQVFRSPACAEQGCPVDPQSGIIDCVEREPGQNQFGCDLHGRMQLRDINSTPPTVIVGKAIQLNPHFVPRFVRQVFTVVRLASGQPGGVPAYLKLLFGSKGWILTSKTAKSDILSYGFLPIHR